ncbi:6100_t:CDS:2 [Ambispora gerdemannii]|uniref:6100_t:CDS:1 n=1 Tax=Ambispora gerdemannii TaxID=144530 RepID=A0A9N9APR7_9GLOM|nr:6100_t:CDS:2 [Ambispora gerdemannii]
MENTYSENLKVTVLVNDDVSVLTELPKAANLTEIRKILAKVPEIRMGHKAYFICLRVEGTPIIPHNNERKYFLEDVIDDTKNPKNMKIKGELEPNWTEIINNNLLEYGFFFTENGPKSATEKAFKIVKFPKTTLPNQIVLDQELNCKTEIDEIRIKSLFLTTNLDAKLPSIPIFARFGGSCQSNNVKHKNNVNSKTYQKSIRIKAIFSMSESEIKPTEEFVLAVDKALESKNRRKSLEQVSSEFGEFWCKKLGIGGSILYVKKGGSIVNENKRSKGKEVKVNLSFGGGVGGKNEETNQMNAVASEYTCFEIRGGLKNLFRERDPGEWFTSLEDYKTWEVAAYFPEIHSIFDILDEERRAKVAEAFGTQIIDSQVVDLGFMMDISKPDPCIYEIPKQYDLSNCQIFVTEMKDMKDDNSDTIFASRVHYMNEKEPPVILLHRLGSLAKKTKYQKFSIKLGWIVLGTSTMLPTKLVFENGESKIKVGNKNCSASIISSRELCPDESLLATCVSRSKDSQVNFAKSKYVTRSHFVYENNAIDACAFCYDLKTGELFYQLDNLEATFSINYSIIFGRQIDEFGQAQINSESRISIKSTRHKIDFGCYRNLTQPCLQSPVFVNLVLDKCPKQCPHGILNITPNHAEFKHIYFSSPNLKDRQIAYFRAPIRINDKGKAKHYYMHYTCP